MKIFNINQKESYNGGDKMADIIGNRGCYLNEMASLRLPISPAFIFSSESFKSMREDEIKDNMKKGVASIEEIVDKKYGDVSNPLLLKVVLSPSINLSIIHSIHNLGLNNETIKGFSNKISEKFALQEYRDLILNFLERFTENKISKDKIEDIKKLDFKEACDVLLTKYEVPFIMDPYEQLNKVFLKSREAYFTDDLNKEIPCALVVQGMIFGNYPNESFSGHITTRDTVSGEKVIRGFYVPNEFESTKEKSVPIESIPSKYFRELEKTADKLESKFKEIRRVKFVVEDASFWLIDQFAETDKSVKASIKILLDIYNRKIVNDDYVLNNITSSEISSLLYPEVDINSASKIKCIQQGEMGSPGAARGRIFFSTTGMIEANQDAKIKGEDSSTILCLRCTNAGDVQAIEIGDGVICSEGGYSSHAPVVARSLGKPAIIGTDFDIREDRLIIGEHTIKEGDYISIDVSPFDAAKIYLGKAELVISSPKDNGLLEIMDLVSSKLKKLKEQEKLCLNIMANADTVKDTERALSFGADGVGLCRTEHMFFAKDRIDIFRSLLISDNDKLRSKVLGQLKKIQKQDFYNILQLLDGKVLTVRLLDAPLHEFIPTKTEDIDKVKILVEKEEPDITTKELQNRYYRLKEINPMLGNRGCRFGISNPEVYEMQIASLLEAAAELHFDTNGSTKIDLKVMFPLVSSSSELKFLINGKDIEGTVIPGFKGVEKSILKKYNYKTWPFNLKLGVMIELPSASLFAADLAKYASFFSFGTNDLTQTTHGISRDDINSFYPSYTKYDIADENPFMFLSEPVKQLILHATSNGKLTRPDIDTSLCGEHGAETKNIEFCIKNNINAVSCSPFKVPLARLAVVKFFLN